jgi:hypothetical protein
LSCCDSRTLYFVVFEREEWPPGKGGQL